LTNCSRAGAGAWFNYTFLTKKERDIETGLDFFEARYFGSSHGRFTSPDPLGGHTEDPQTLDRYSYVRNNPERLTDPTGLDFYLTCNKEGKTCHDGQQGTYDKKRNFTATLIRNDKNGNLVDQNGNRYTANITGKGVWFTQAGGDRSTLGVFQNGTNATTIQGSASNGLEGFTFNFTSSNLNVGQTAAGAWSFNGTVDQAERALELAGYTNSVFDSANIFHPSTETYDAVDYRSTGTADTGEGSGHFTVHEPVRISERIGARQVFFKYRIPVRDTVPTTGDVHFGEHYPYGSLEGLRRHSGEVKRSVWP